MKGIVCSKRKTLDVVVLRKQHTMTHHELLAILIDQKAEHFSLHFGSIHAVNTATRNMTHKTNIILLTRVHGARERMIVNSTAGKDRVREEV